MSDNKKNLVQFTNKWTPEMAREYGRRGGKASGESRRRKAAFRKGLNALLTVEIDSPEWTPLLKSMDLDSTLEMALLAALLKEGLAGNVKAFEAIGRFAGQSEKTELDEQEQEIRIQRAAAAYAQEIAAADLQEELGKARAELAKAQAELAREKARKMTTAPADADDGVEIVNDLWGDENEAEGDAIGDSDPEI